MLINVINKITHHKSTYCGVGLLARGSVDLCESSLLKEKYHFYLLQNSHTRSLGSYIQIIFLIVYISLFNV